MNQKATATALAIAFGAALTIAAVPASAAETGAKEKCYGIARGVCRLHPARGRIHLGGRRAHRRLAARCQQRLLIVHKPRAPGHGFSRRTAPGAGRRDPPGGLSSGDRHLPGDPGGGRRETLPRPGARLRACAPAVFTGTDALWARLPRARRRQRPGVAAPVPARPGAPGAGLPGRAPCGGRPADRPGLPGVRPGPTGDLAVPAAGAASLAGHPVLGRTGSTSCRPRWTPRRPHSPSTCFPCCCRSAWAPGSRPWPCWA